MSDLSGDDLAKIGIGGGGVVGILYGLVKWLGNRNLDALDKSIATLNTTLAALNVEVQKLREMHIGLAKDVGALQEQYRSLEKRIDGQADFYRSELAAVRAQLPPRKTK